MRIALIGLMIIMLAGCAGGRTAQQYTYGDIPPALEGRWIGYASEYGVKDRTSYELILRRGQITNITYYSHNCGGRLKYQRTEADGSFIYLEQIELGDTQQCMRNSYLRLTPRQDGTMAYLHHDMKGKPFSEGIMRRKNS